MFEKKGRQSNTRQRKGSNYSATATNRSLISALLSSQAGPSHETARSRTNPVNATSVGCNFGERGILGSDRRDLLFLT